MKRCAKIRTFSRCAALLTGAFLLAALVSGQTLTPGQLPQGPPPAPGQLGPAPETLPPNQPTPNPQEQRIENGASNDPNVIRVPVKYVLVPTTVLDPDGHGYVNGLDKSDFQVLDNGKPQKITSDFSQQPFSVVLAVQANSEVEPLLPAIRKSGILMQGLVTGAQGDVAVLAFDHRMQVLQDFTDDASKLEDAMQKLTSGSSTSALVDAVMKADQMLRDHDRQNVRRRVVVLLSRDIDKGSQIHLEEAIHRMQFDNIIVYCVDMSRLKTAFYKQPDYPRPANGGVPPEAMGNSTGQVQTQTSVAQQMDGNWLNVVPVVGRGMKDLFKKSPAEAFTYFTGGNIYSFSNQKGLETAITDIGKDLSSQYMLSYALSNIQDPGFHTIRVVVDRPGLVVRTRPGYWWGGGQ
jgi:VWFA-related protein